MTTPINKAFEITRRENRTALITYIVGGDNSKFTSLKILKSLTKYVDIFELGFPHNTPIADGGQIQTSAYRAIRNGIKISDIFKLVKDFKRNKLSKPLILMGYYNMIYQYGENEFINQCKKSGVDGLIVVDLPWPENIKFSKKCKKNKICFVQLISPTTSYKRAKKIINSSHEMVYYISMLSTTGGKLKVKPREIIKKYNKIKKINPKKNCVIGFGITEKTIKKLNQADGLVIGSAICNEITKSLEKRQNPVTNVSKIVIRLKSKIS
tara:strand:+ start:9462 stop:10262 length:801 start_codon:yes stop_codon:yes gene_type:complete